MTWLDVVNPAPPGTPEELLDEPYRSPLSPGVQVDVSALRGDDGFNAYTTTTAPFVVPALNTNVTIEVVRSEWMVEGQPIAIGNAGAAHHLRCVSKPSLLTAILRHVADLAATAAANVLAGTGVAPSGERGSDGADGLPGAPGSDADATAAMAAAVAAQADADAAQADATTALTGGAHDSTARTALTGSAHDATARANATTANTTATNAQTTATAANTTATAANTAATAAQGTADRATVNPNGENQTVGAVVPAVGSTVDVVVNYLPNGLVNGDTDKVVYVEGLGQFKADAISTTSLRLKNIGLVTPGVALPAARAIQGLAGGSVATRTDPKVEFWVPDPWAWEDTGVVAPARQGAVFRVGTTLYMFGGFAAAATNKIYSATYDASGTTPVFTDTGATLPAAAQGLRVVLLGSTFYAYAGKATPQTAIWTAALATPTAWSATGSSIIRRDNAPIVVSSTRVSIIGGHNGAVGFNTIQSALLATPTVVTEGAGVMNNNWEAGAAIVGSDQFLYWGGTGTETTTIRKAKASILNLYGNIPSCGAVFAIAQTAASEMFALGDCNLIYGGTNAGFEQLMLNADATAYQRMQNTLALSLGYPYHCSWIGGDGRAYCVATGGTQKIARTYRRRVLVRASEVNAANLVGPYSPLVGTYDDGTPAIVSTHVRMSVAPWLTSRRTAF